MARIRTIKPEFAYDEELSRLPHITRLFFSQMWCHMDKAGRAKDEPGKLRALIFPYEPEVDADKLLEQLHPKFVLRYRVGAIRLLQVVTWKKHQRPTTREPESELPGPDKGKALPKQCSSSAQAVLEHDPSMLGKGKGKGRGMEEGKGTDLARCALTVTATDLTEANGRQPRPRTPAQRVLEAYKVAKNVPMLDKAWDKANFGRYSRAAVKLLERFGGDLDKAAAYLFSRGVELDEKGLEWTLETIVRHAWDGAGMNNTGAQDEREDRTLGDGRAHERGGARGLASSGEVVRDTLRAIEASAVHAKEDGRVAGLEADQRGDEDDVP